MRLVAATLSVALFCCGLFVLAQAQEGRPVGPNPPCSAFGTAAGTCAQGNDARLGAGAVTGAVKSNGSNSFSQAACADLSNGTALCSTTPGTGVATALAAAANGAGGFTTTPSCSWTPSDGSGAGLTFTAVASACTRIGNMVFAYAKFTYPTTADSSHAIITGLPVTVPNAAYASQICTLSQGTGTYYQLQTIANTITAAFFSITGTNFANSGLSATQIDMMCVYPAA